MRNLIKYPKIYSFLISLVYVGFGTISVLCSYPPYFNTWVLFLILLTFPVSIISLGVLFTGKYYIIVLFIQLLMFFITWYIIYKLILNYKNKKIIKK